MPDLYVFRHIEDRPDQRCQIVLLLQRRKQQIGDMNEADNPVLVLKSHRITGMLRLRNDPHIFFQRKIAV
ncbi:hypothetical protein D3C80_1867530 [compost metagenome]